MIPTIETIIEDLLADKISKSQAVNWLHQHAEGPIEDLRDHFAGQALAGMGTWVPGRRINGEMLESSGSLLSPETREARAEWAYAQADAMLRERENEAGR
jgi:hypothetical protein